MRVIYKATGHSRNVSDSIGIELVSRGIAESAESDDIEREPEIEISKRTGKPKRKYKRKDMRAED